MKTLDLFAGIGGFSLAARWMGWQTAAVCEIDPWCRQVLANHFPDADQYADIRTFDATPYRGAIDLVCGGFPCQDASNARTHVGALANAGQGLDGARTGLWWEMRRIIDEARPRFVVGENVTAIRGKGLGRILQSLAEIGYDAEWCDMPANWFGAPHSRARTWIVAYPHGFGRGEESVVFGRILSQAIPQAPKWESSRAIRGPYGKAPLPASYGILDGLPRGVDDAAEIKSHGNAVAPWVVYQIFRAIAATENALLNEAATLAYLT